LVPRVRIAVTFAVLMATAFAWSPAAAPAGAAAAPVVGQIPPRYTGTPITGPENVTFLYHSLAEASAAGQLANIGHPRDLVFGNENTATVPGTADEPIYAHSIGARAFKYMQFSMFPMIYPTWSGITKENRAAWAMCQVEDEWLHDHEDGDGTSHGSVPWAYADTNERGYVDAILAWTAQLKALGYDGVFIDVGGRSIRGPYFNVESSCTDDPITPGAKSADAWFAMLMRVKAQGLKLGVNMGAPTADPLTRPDPNNPSKVKTDVRAFTWILHEGAGHPKENYKGDAAWLLPKLPLFDHLAKRNANDALYARGQVVEMAKARLPIGHPNRLRQEEYVWALAKISGSPVVLNTGYDFCNTPWGTTDCNRTGLAPALTDLRLGSPIDAAPYPAACNGTSCMWVRRFYKGMVVVSAYGSPARSAAVPLGTAKCRRITAFQGGQQAQGLCVNSLRVQTNATRWSRIYLYSP
jgi:hypothetical protein